MDHSPDPEAEWGHDAHYVDLCAGDPDHVWQHNHVGIFYSDNGAQRWQAVSKAAEGVHFGFPVATDDRDGKTAWVVLGHSDQQRMAIDGGLFVARTHDGGANWAQLRDGLPQNNAHDVVYRHALDQAGGVVAFGSTTGNLYVSDDRGDHWTAVAHNLPPTHPVRLG